MKRILMHPLFSLLLVTALIFTTCAIANAQITVSFMNDGNTSVTVTLTYTTAPSPAPTFDDFVFDPATDVAFDGGTDNDPLTYFITWSNLVQPAPVYIFDFAFTLFTYNEVDFSLTSVEITSQTSLTVNSGLSNNRLVRNPNLILGGTYLLIASNDDDIMNGTFFPTLPRVAPDGIRKIAWSSVSDEPVMPDLYALFQDGGTLNLRLNQSGSTNRVGSETAAGTYDDNHGRNQRQVVINEVMWAQDERHIGSAQETQEQWIELYVRGDGPFFIGDIRLSTSKTFPAPPAETDRLSNVSSLSNVWEIESKGQHGNSGSPRLEFKSMQRVERDDNFGDGSLADNWQTATRLFLRNYRGTPGEQNIANTLPTPRSKPSKDNPAKNKVIINEIGNLVDNTLDWIELRNVTNSEQSLKDWVLTRTTGIGNEEEIIRFTDDPDVSIPARGVLLLVNEDPQNTPLSAGYDISFEEDDQSFGAGIHEYFIVDDNKISIPNDDKWLLILRNNKPWDVGDSKNVYQTGYRVQDVSGPGALHQDFVVMDLDVLPGRFEKDADGDAGDQDDGNDVWHTKVFPLNGNTQDDADFLQSDRLNDAGKVWVRDGDIQGYLKDAWTKAGYTGIGYDRAVSINDAHGGTPGYDNNVAKEKIAQLDGGKLIVSELMLSLDSRGSPQWIELFNTSKTRGIDLAADSSDPKTGWQIIIENHDSGSWNENRRPLNVTVNLKDLFPYGIPPNQSVLIVSAKGRVSNRDYYPASRVAGIFETKRDEFGMKNRKDPILNAEGGFYIGIVDGEGTISDQVGNLDGLTANLREGIPLDDPYSWDWSTDLTEDGYRTSLIRLKDKNGRPRVAVPDRTVDGSLRGAVLPMGMNKRPAGYAWVHAVDTAFDRVRFRETWYGSVTDISTPGFIRGTPLPVSLSFFRPTLENGEVVIRWTTESEVDNAGFNILRSTNRSGEFTQVNSALIQGAGTSGERNAYKWIDTTAKQGVVYYYQIEDVSYAGERQLLTTTRLKGMISPRSKLTTTWSQLKTLR